MPKFNTNKLYLLTVILLAFYAITFVSGCDNESNAQGNETQFTETYSGSFVSASTVTDTNDDGSLPPTSANLQAQAPSGLLPYRVSMNLSRHWKMPIVLMVLSSQT